MSEIKLTKAQHGLARRWWRNYQGGGGLFLHVTGRERIVSAALHRKGIGTYLDAALAPPNALTPDGGWAWGLLDLGTHEMIAYCKKHFTTTEQP